MLQLPVPSSPALNTPLAAGYLAAYAEAQGLGELARITILPRAIADHAGDAALVDAIVARAPNLLGLSLTPGTASAPSPSPCAPSSACPACASSSAAPRCSPTTPGSSPTPPSISP